MSSISVLKSSLPNFPCEVLEEWLLPYATSEGWPPADTDDSALRGRWRYLLKNMPLEFWKSLTWNKVQRHISIQDLSNSCQEVMVSMVLAAIENHNNIYSASIPDLKERFHRIVAHIRATGNLPCPPVLICEGDGLGIVDGNHRMAAYFYCYGYFKLDVDCDLQLKTNEMQHFWIGTT